MSRATATATLCVGLLAVAAHPGCDKKKAAVHASSTSPRPEPAKARVPPPPPKPRPRPRPMAPSKLLAPERAPHPDYPTPRLARTDKIFLLEEPDRGPVVTAAPAATLAGLRYAVHDHCEVDHGRVACGRAGRAGVRRYYRVGRRGRQLVRVEQHFGPRVEQTTLLEHAASGKLARVVTLDQRGNVESSLHFDASGARYSERELDGSNGLPGCGFHQLALDKAGRVERVTCLQWSSAPMRNTRGVVTRALARDRRGLVVGLRNLDGAGKPVDDTHGVHQEKIVRDKQGRPIARRFFDAQGFPALSSAEGCYGLRYRHDARGQVVSWTCLGAKEQDRPINDEAGACRYERRYDGRGCEIATTNVELDAAGSCAKTFKRWRYEVDATCRRLRTRCEDGAGRSIGCARKGAAELRYTVDDRGYRTATKHFDASGQPTGDRDCGAFEERVARDIRGKVVKKSYFGKSGEPADCSAAGYHGVTFRHDDAGRTIETRFVDRSGKPGTNLGCAIRRFRYDNYDHQVESVNHDAAGGVIEVLGLAHRKTIYDPAHRTFGILLYDKAGKPARYRGCFVGRTCPGKPWHAVRIVRRENGSVRSNQYFDAAGQLLKTIDCGKQRCWQ